MWTGMRLAEPEPTSGRTPERIARCPARAWMTENRGVPSSSLGLAIKKYPATGGAFRCSPPRRQRHRWKSTRYDTPWRAATAWGVMRGCTSHSLHALRPRGGPACGGDGPRREIPSTQASADTSSRSRSATDARRLLAKRASWPLLLWDHSELTERDVQGDDSGKTPQRRATRVFSLTPSRVTHGCENVVSKWSKEAANVSDSPDPRGDGRECGQPVMLPSASSPPAPLFQVSAQRWVVHKPADHTCAV